MLYSRVLRAGAIALVFGMSPVAAKAESLRDALASAYANNPMIAAALLSVKVSAEDIALRRAGKMPNVSASADYSANWSVTGGTSTVSDTFTLGLTYRHTLFDNLKTDADIEQARALAVVAAQSLRNAEQNVLLSAASAYMNVMRDTKLVQLRADNVKFLRAQVQSAKDRLRIGEGTKIAVAQAETSLAQSVASYKSAVNDLRTSQASFERWIGHKPQNLNMDFRFGSILPSTLDRALDKAKRQHPAVLSAIAQVRAAQAGTDAARAAFGPTLDLIGTICAVECFGAGNFGVNSSIKLSLTIPLYAGGALGATARKANLNQIKSEVDARAASDEVRESVISAWSGMQTAIAQIESARSAVSSAQLALDGVIEELKVGQSTTLDVLDSRATLTSAREVQISAQSSRIIAAFSLTAAAGSLSAVDLDLPVRIQSAQGYTEKVEDIWQELRAVPN